MQRPRRETCFCISFRQRANGRENRSNVVGAKNRRDRRTIAETNGTRAVDILEAGVSNSSNGRFDGFESTTTLDSFSFSPSSFLLHLLRHFFFFFFRSFVCVTTRIPYKEYIGKLCFVYLFFLYSKIF